MAGKGDFAGSPRVLGILLPPTQLALSAQPWSTEPQRCDGREGEGKGQGWALEGVNNQKKRGVGVDSTTQRCLASWDWGWG